MAESEDRADADRYLMAGIRNGDEESWSQLIGRYQGRLLAFARRKLGPSGEVEDVVQETFVGFVQSLPTYDESRSLETYLFSILRHQIIRAQQRFLSAKAAGFDPLEEMGSDAEIPSPGESPSGGMRGRELRREQCRALADALYELIREMRDRGRLEDLMTVELSFFVGMRNRDTAETLSREEAHVAAIKHRAIERVRQLIGGTGELADEISISSVWRSHRLTCLKRSTLGAYQVGILDEPWQSFCRFHLETVKCELCLANAEDLAGEAAESNRSSLRERIFASSAGFLSGSGGTT